MLRCNILLVAASLTGCPRQSATVVDPSAPAHFAEHDVQAAHAHLLSAAGSSDPVVRSMAIVALAGNAGLEADAFLMRGVLDPSPFVQRTVAGSLPEQALSAMVGRASVDPIARAVALAGVSAEKRTQVPFEMDRSRPGDLVSDALLGDQQAMDGLLLMAREGSLPPEAALFKAMVRTESVALGEALADGIPLAEDLIRVQMAVAAQRLAPSRAAGALSAALSESTIEQRLEAVEGLVENDTPGGRDFLHRAAKAGPGAVQEYAQLALAALGEQPINVAIDALTSPDRDVRAWSAICLMHASTDRPLHRGVIPGLQVARQDEAPAVRQAAVQALLAISGTSSVPIHESFWAAKPGSVSVMIAASLWSERRVSKGSISPP
jgi:hypothetical protein